MYHASRIKHHRMNDMRTLPQVTLIGVDCVDVDRLLHVAEICQRSIRFGYVRLLTSNAHDHPSIVPIAPITSREAYSSFMIKRINSYVATPFALVIQYDGFILNPDAWRDEFLDYDYIGASWNFCSKMMRFSTRPTLIPATRRKTGTSA